MIKYDNSLVKLKVYKGVEKIVTLNFGIEEEEEKEESFTSGVIISSWMKLTFIEFCFFQCILYTRVLRDRAVAIVLLLLEAKTIPPGSL